ncbi:MAG TPA: glycosyltransferase family 2 protein [Bryobacteraceae bacterium]|nr:glycosyltransferase family 2 protein [Bryobacteraceae bacterium]
MLTVAAVIPHWNRRDLLESLFSSLGSQTRAFDEIILVDNGSTDDSAELAERHATVIRLDKNLGFAAAVNRGIASTNADWIAILNNDVTLAPDWLEQILSTDAQFATGKILNAADHSLIDGTFDEISRAGCPWRCGQGRPDAPVWNQPRPIRMAPMTAALFRRSLFSELGPLDENFGSYLEDVDFGIRCALAGFEGRYIPSAVARHRGSATRGAWNKDTVKQIARNQILLTYKYFQGQPRWPLVAGQMLWGLVALRHFRGVSYLRGKFSGWNAARALYREKINIPEDRFSRFATASEQQIFALQKQTGFDRYWRVYFWLSPPSL